jgi:hypothetical protein
MRAVEPKGESVLLLLTVTFAVNKIRHNVTSSVTSSATRHIYQCPKDVTDVTDYEFPCSEFLLKGECERTCALAAKNGLCQWVAENR